jgi:hypothetical protein
MSPLGVDVETLNALPVSGATTSIDTAFVPGTWSAGPVDKAVECRSMVDVEANFSTRTANASNQAVWDWLDNFFREGGRRAIVSRYTVAADTDELADALALFNLPPFEDIPGQVVAPSEVPTADVYATLLDHAKTSNRFAICDVNKDDDVAERQVLGDDFMADPNHDCGMLAGDWLSIPAPAGVVGGGARQVAGSSTVAALCARSDALGNPNRAAAGRDFPLQYATGIVSPVSSADRETLLNHGVNTFAVKLGVLQLYGFQTGVAQTPDNPYWQANASRGRMWLVARAKEQGEHYMFKNITKRLMRAFKTDLDAICLELYGVDGLYGDTPAEAFATDTGVALNPDANVAQGELQGAAEVRWSEHAKTVRINLVTVPITGSVSA